MILGFDGVNEDTVSKTVKSNLDKYGLGKKRSLKQYFEFAGIDAANKRIFKNFCPQHNGVVKQDESHLAKMEREKQQPQQKSKENFTGLSESPVSSSGTNGSWMVLWKLFCILVIAVACLLGYEPRLRLHVYQLCNINKRLCSIFSYFQTRKTQK